MRSRSWAASRSRRASASSAAAASTAAAAALSPNAKSTTEVKMRDWAAWAAMIRALAVPWSVIAWSMSALASLIRRSASLARSIAYLAWRCAASSTSA